MALKFVILLCLSLHLLGCDYINNTFNSIDTSKIKAYPSKIEASVKWGGKYSTTANAEIESVLFECIKNYGTDEKSKSKQREYDIALTSNVNYQIFNDYISPLYADIIFEAKSKSGVVLGMAKGTAKLINGSSKSTVSAKIIGLSSAEMEKVSYIIARWDFGS